MPKVQTEVLSRPPWERMMRIHSLLQAKKYPNCSRLKRDLEISVRTVLRDIDFMKYRLNLPIEYDKQRYGFYYSKPVEQFPSVGITEAEVFALLVAHKAIAQYHGTPFQTPLETAFRKLTGQLDQDSRFTVGNLDGAVSFRPFAPADADLKTFQLLTQSIQERRVFRFLYRNLGAKTANQRHVHPYHLACIDNHWYLFAFDADRQAMRTFVLTRMRSPQLTKKRFKAAKFNPDEYLKGSFTVFKGGDDYEVVVEFDTWATDLVRGRTWHSSQELTEFPNGFSRLRMRLNNIEEMERWVLSWGQHATVIRPENLVKRLQETADVLKSRYSKRA